MICSAEDLFALNSDKFRMVYKVDGNPQLDSRDWSMYLNILNCQDNKKVSFSERKTAREVYCVQSKLGPLLKLPCMMHVQYTRGVHHEYSGGYH